jgi:hypothetical protein
MHKRRDPDSDFLDHQAVGGQGAATKECRFPNRHYSIGGFGCNAAAIDYHWPFSMISVLRFVRTNADHKA